MGAHDATRALLRAAAAGADEDAALTARLPRRLAEALGAEPEVVTRAPGRANLIGEHTDYNDGFVLPVALDLQTVVAGRRDERVRLRSLDEPGLAEVDLGDGSGTTEGWGRYVTAVAKVLLDEGLRVRGIDGVVASDVPAGNGLSSSAALEVSVALALLDEPVAPVRVAQLCQRAENVHVGVRSGIMDQLASVAARSSHALFVDCRSLETDDVPVPEGLAVLVIDSGQRRDLGSGEYNARRAECEEAAKLLGVESLRDVSDARDVEALPEPMRWRARHVVTENRRVIDAVGALRAGDRAALRALFAASHASLARDFAVSTAELDTLVEVASRTDGVVAARLTGAGFGGCTVNLVEADAARAAASAIGAEYSARTGRAARWWISAAAAGAIELRNTARGEGGRHAGS